MTRNLKGTGLDEGPRPACWYMRAKLIHSGVDPVVACRPRWPGPDDCYPICWWRSTRTLRVDCSEPTGLAIPRRLAMQFVPIWIRVHASFGALRQTCSEMPVVLPT